MRAIWAVPFVCGCWAVGAAQITAPSASPGAVISFTYENEKFVPPYYRITVHEDGSGSYESRDGGANGALADPGKPFEQQIRISTPLLQDIVGAARQHKFFAVPCEATKIGRVAYRGKKTLMYRGPDGAGSCTYNYSLIKQIQHLGDDLESVASTIETGRRLLKEHQHDRLSLDAELGALVKSAGAGQSLELENIRPVLDAIASDPGVLNRARERATLLLAGGGKH